MLSIGASGVTVDGITLDGNRQNQPPFPDNPQRHGVLIGSVADTTIRNVTSTGHAGDGYCITGDATGTKFLGCRSADCERNGLTIGTGTIVSVLVDGCDLEATVQPVDSEPTSGSSTGVRVTGCQLRSTTGDYAITATSGRDWIISGNTLIGSIHIYEADGVVIVGNTIDARASTQLHAVRHRAGGDLIVAHNHMRPAVDMYGLSFFDGLPERHILGPNIIVLSGSGWEIVA